jgi:exodeoxyribonuclease I
MFTRSADLPEGMSRLPIKTIHLNKSPIVISNLKTLSDERAAHWGIDVAQALSHAELAAKGAHLLNGMWPAVFERPVSETAADVDEDLYSGFVGQDDRRSLQRLRGMKATELATVRPNFTDPRLHELFFRYRARNFPMSLTEAEQHQWQEHCAHRLHDGVDGGLTLSHYFDQIDTLGEDADERAQDILGALVDYATQIAPDRD